MAESRKSRDLGLFGALLVVLVYAALPVSSNPVNQGYYNPPSYPEPSYQSSYQSYSEPSYQSYEPTYQQSYKEPSYQSYEPAYQQSYKEPSYQSYSEPSYQQYKEPSYQSYSEPSYQPNYQQYKEPSYQSYSEPSYQQSYSKPAYYAPPPPTYKSEYYPEYVKYEAITYQELNESIHCGVIPATNNELYKNAYGGYQYQPEYGYGKSASNYALSSPIAPFGKFPWTVVITDAKNNIRCEGSVVNAQFVLTLASCIQGYDVYDLRVRFGEWDLLNNANEYEPYQNAEGRICRSYPVPCSYGYSAPKPSYGYGYSQPSYQEAELVLLETEFDFDKDEYPQIRAVCLPEYYQQSYAPAYQAPSYTPAYQAPSYAPAPAYQAPSYAPAPAYQAPSYAPAYQPPSYEPSYAAAPYYPQPAYEAPYQQEYYSECWVVGYYGSPTTKLQNHPAPTPYEGYGYQASYPEYQSSYGGSYYEDYQSLIPRMAKVKQIKCESYSGYKSQSGGYGGYSQGCERSCFVGVEGDACVASKGSAVVCLVQEKASYDSGYQSNYEASYQQGYGSSSYPSESYGYKQEYYKKQIQAAPAQVKQERKRAVVVGVVEYPAQCQSSYSKPQYGYGYQVQETQSNPIVAIKVTEKVVDFILEKFWEGAEDKSCPAPKSYYAEPQYSEPSYPSYQASYAPSYEPSYPQPSYEPSYPQPSYPKPSYQAPSYPQPSYETSYPQPSYQPPSYNYEPSYPQPSYEPSYPQPSYEPSYPKPSYQAPSYEPSYPQPSYQPPSYNYEPSYPQPSYEPSYPKPSYQAPSYPQPSYEPSYAKPSYQAPSYPAPSYGYNPKPAY